jgi:hypothetical protein
MSQIKERLRRLYFAQLRRNNVILEHPIVIQWKVSEFRNDKRTGATSCVPMSVYAKKQYDDTMRRWSV